MATVRYLGSKARVVGQILDLVGPPSEQDGFFVDAFCGTGVVAARAADLGWPVRINDHLRSATIMARAQLVSSSDAPFAELGGYEAALARLNALPGRDGFFWREYSPASETGRMYFTEENARRIDAIRDQINRWEASGALSGTERDLLVADLIAAANQVANIAGTYGCFLSRWSQSALRDLRLEPRKLRPAPVEHEVHSRDVLDVPVSPQDVAYYDPPYTKRQYAAYYHILETLAWGDEPEVTGKTGLRPWRDKASDYCYKSRALDALASLLRSAPAKRIFLSYSNEGHVDLDELIARIEPLGEVTLHELAAIGRYRPNRAASAAGEEVIEYVVELEQAAVAEEEGAVT